MATSYKTGDTWPPISGTVLDANDNAVDVSTADSLRFIAKRVDGTEVIEGVATNNDDGTPELRGRWEYVWAAGDLDVAGEYETEIEVVWDSGTTPPKLETFPDDKEINPRFTVTQDLD